MEQDYNIFSSRHRRIEDGWEGLFSHVDRNITVVRSFDWVDLMIIMLPLVGPTNARLIGFDGDVRSLAVQQRISEANVLKYTSDNSDYIFYLRNKKNIEFHISPFITMSRFIDPIELAFAEDEDLLVVLKHKRKDLIIEYYL